MRIKYYVLNFVNEGEVARYKSAKAAAKRVRRAMEDGESVYVSYEYEPAEEADDGWCSIRC